MYIGCTECSNVVATLLRIQTSKRAQVLKGLHQSLKMAAKKTGTIWLD